MDSVLTALKCRNTDITLLAVNVIPSEVQVASRWSAFMVHLTKQLFLTSQSPLPLCKVSLVAMLDTAEQLGVSEAFVCIRRNSPETAVLVSEFASMGFKNLSPRLQPLKDFIVLRFDF